MMVPPKNAECASHSHWNRVCFQIHHRLLLRVSFVNLWLRFRLRPFARRIFLAEKCHGKPQKIGPSRWGKDWHFVPGTHGLSWMVTASYTNREMGLSWKWVFPGVPKDGWFIREHPFKMDDLGVAILGSTHMASHVFCLYPKSDGLFTVSQDKLSS